MTEEINNQEEVLEQTEQEQELVEAPEQVAEETVEEEKIEEAVERRQRASVVGNSTDRADSLASLPQVPNPAMDGGSIQTGSSFEAGSSDNFGAGNPAYSDQAS